MPDSFENLNNKPKLENVGTALKLENPERAIEEMAKLESDISTGAEKVEKEGELLIESGLKSTGTENEGLLSAGKNVLKTFKEKAEKLTNQYTKLKALLLVPLVAGTMGASNPELSQSEKLPNKTEVMKQKEYVYADQETTEEMKLLTENYIQEFRTKNPDSKISDKELQIRFNDLAQTYKDHFKIHVGHAEGLIENVALKLASYKGESGVPDGVHEHNALGTIYYEDHGNLRGFIHEIPHQINDDVTIGKGATYLQDLGAAAIKGGDIYHTFGTIEFSAHEITEKAVKEYLFSKSSNEGGLPKTETFQSYLQKKRNAMMALYEACGPFAEHIDRFPDMSYQIINDIPSLQYAIHEGVKMVSEDKYPEDKIKDRALYLQNYMDILMDEGGLNLEDAKEYLASSF